MAEKLERIALHNLRTQFHANPHRGIAVGMNESKIPMQFSWIMGRSENSQNRLYVVENGVLKTIPADPSKVKNPELIIYNAMRGMNYKGKQNPQIVSNGVQTDSVWERINTKVLHGEGVRPYFFFESLEEFYCHLFCEPDPPIFTSRITGFQNTCEDLYEVALSVLKADPFAKQHWIEVEKKANEEGTVTKDMFEDIEEYHKAIGELAELNHRAFPTIRDPFIRRVRPGFGYCLTTYQPGNSAELPSFEGEPVLIPIRGTLEEAMNTIWEHLDPEWRVALGGKEIREEGIRYAKPKNPKIRVD